MATALAHLENGHAVVRNGHDWTEKFQTIASAVEQLPARDAILDGEAVVIAPDGLSDFHGLRSELGKPKPRVQYQAFDLLWLDGEDLRRRPWQKRKERLWALLALSRVGYVEHFEARGADVLERVCGVKLEGIISKQVDAPYQAGRSPTWLKSKCEVSDTFAIVGFSENERAIEGLYLARRAGGALRYAGAVENGFSDGDLRELKRRLDPLRIRRSPLGDAMRKARAQWVQPAVLVEITFPNTSADGRLRHPSFKGFRDDIQPS